jgi:hypothetical protein
MELEISTSFTDMQKGGGCDEAVWFCRRNACARADRLHARWFATDHVFAWICLGACRRPTGDRAVGKWSGLSFTDIDRTRLTPSTAVLTIEKNADGSFTCSLSRDAASVQLSTCNVEPNAIDVVGPRTIPVRLERAGPDLLRGEYKSARNRRMIVQATRVR